MDAIVAYIETNFAWIMAITMTLAGSSSSIVAVVNYIRNLRKDKTFNAAIDEVKKITQDLVKNAAEGVASGKKMNEIIDGFYKDITDILTEKEEFLIHNFEVLTEKVNREIAKLEKDAHEYQLRFEAEIKELNKR